MKSKLQHLKLLIDFYINSKRKKHIFLLGTPVHGNVGDLAIAEAETDLMKKKGLHISEMPSYYVLKHLEFIKKCIKTEKIYIHGGGFIGTYWPEEEKMFECLLSEFAENEIIVLPQTIYFEEIDERLEQLNRVLRKCCDVTICAREEYSFEFAKEYLENAKIILTPDMVLGLEVPTFKNQRDKIIVCMRADLEKNVSEDEQKKIIECLEKKYPMYEVVYRDTVLNKIVMPWKRRKVIDDMCNIFSTGRILITDRLHGMVLSALSNTSTIVMSNGNYKVRGIYNWIKSNEYVKYGANTDEILELICSSEDEKDNMYSRTDYLEDYKIIEDIIC